jgi:hypothetical protein
MTYFVSPTGKLLKVFTEQDVVKVLIGMITVLLILF